MKKCQRTHATTDAADQALTQTRRFEGMSVVITRRPTKTHFILLVVVGLLLIAAEFVPSPGWSQNKGESQEDLIWLDEIEKAFIPSSQCRQCHERHFEEWKGMRERSEDLLSFGRMDGGLLHGTALKSPVFRTVLGLWLQTYPTHEQRTKCLACHVPAVTVFPQHADRIIDQVMRGPKHVQVEGIGCASCHLIQASGGKNDAYPAFQLAPGSTFFGPYGDAEDNLAHQSQKAEIFKGANFCTSCHFSKVKDVTQPHLNGAILKDLVCQNCHMEQSYGSSTDKGGTHSRSLARHWFQGVVAPGIMLSNRNVQAEWTSRLDIEITQTTSSVQGTLHVPNGSLIHMFPGGDPVLKQFIVKVMVKDQTGALIGEEAKTFGRSFEELLRGPIPQPLVNSGITRHIPFNIAVPEDSTPAFIEATISYALMPKPGEELQSRYLATLSGEKQRNEALQIVEHYTAPRLLTFRTKALETIPHPLEKT
ncbi:multiheme c-type cytochrome [Candidatus Nitrospira neomarina]|uniref:Multiheme c-type cytochrome n=1 Tax=Candidatus Nitrospira neomarina TaxID=3020899 RepID=A0AA96JU65_9BACT|nr:multiheme c-type cytochrome [Candidatus Nitrospira neomarina]WNM60237.1 multiheme c-type cytochrome [Candidatus Nitrospira neomarina]